MNTNGIFGDRFGRLGNQLFQIALLFAVEQRTGHGFFVPREGASIWDSFELNVPTVGPECTNVFHERKGWIVYDPEVYQQPDGTRYDGFFQSFRYFDDHRDALLRFLRFRFEYRARAEAELFSHRRRRPRPLVALHVRRGDYVDTGLAHVWGDLAAAGYYDRAIATIGDGVTYVVFSDDIGWCRRAFTRDDVEFADFGTAVSLAMMSSCDVNVIANSSYSWWAAYLNPGAEVYAPSQWFGPAMQPPNDRPDDLLHPSWRTIPVTWPEWTQS